MKAIILVAEGFEDLSLFVPWNRLREEGISVTLASPLMHALTGKHGYNVEPDVRIHDVNPSDYDLLLVPHGAAVEQLRVREAAVDIARTLMQEGNVAVIGHGAQLLLSAGSLDGRTLTCSVGIRDDIRAAGATYRDEAVVRDGNLLSGRGPDDLAEFCREMIRMLRVSRVR